MSTTASPATAAATAKVPLSVPFRFVAAVPHLLSSDDVMRGKGGVLRDLNAGTRPPIGYLAPQLELKSDLGPATRGGSVERPGGWDGGGLNDDGGGNGNSDADAMSRQQNPVADKKDNILRPGDGSSAAQLFTALYGI